MTETITLIIWLWVGMRFEEVCVPNLERGECVERLMAIGGDRGSRRGDDKTDDKAHCIGSNGDLLRPSCAPRHDCQDWPAKSPANHWSGSRRTLDELEG